MIVGIGSDLVLISRVKDAIWRWGDRFIDRIFCEEEIRYCIKKRDSASSFAARFSAKEACAKALGTGISRGIRWKDICVVRKQGQAPTIELKGKAREIAQTLGVNNIYLTITHEKDLAMTVVILEK